MEERRFGEVPSLETRAEANQSVNRNLRYRQIKECLREADRKKILDGGLSAKECAVMMFEKGYIPTSERNFTAPRLTELCEMGTVVQIGRKICSYTGRKVSVYALKESIDKMYEKRAREDGNI